MKSRLILLASAVTLLTSCVVAHQPGGGVEVIPILPIMVELDDDNYYEQGGYYYYYSNDSWQYSTSRNGRRSELPRSHWPKETRRRGRGHHR